MKTIEAGTRVQIKNVLYPTDFSSAAAAAIPYVAEIAKRFGATLHALHVRPPVINPMTEPATWPTIERAANIAAEKQKQDLLKSFPGLQPEVSIEEGDLWSILSANIERNKIDLIVLGTRGRSGVKKFFLGSTAEEIFRQAPGAVFTVGPSAPAEPHRYGRIAEIVYATDFSPESTAATAYAISLAQEFQAHLTLLHVIANPKSGEFVRPEQLVSSSMHLLQTLVPPEAELWCEPHFAVEQGETAAKILRVAQSRKADLIVLGMHRPGGFPGAATHLPIATAHKVVSQAECPVLTVRG